MKEDVEEADIEMDVGEGTPTRNLAPEQALVPPVTMLAMAGIWVGSQDDQVAEPVFSSRARGKAPTFQVE